MEIAAFLAAGLRDWVDFGVIIGILLLNATVGWYQEKQAADVVASLKADISQKALVIRDGKEVEIKARELVPGDIVSCSYSIKIRIDLIKIIIEDGQVVPADAKLICAYDNPNGYAEYLSELGSQAADSSREKSDEDDDVEKHGSGYALLAIDQSAITGESLAVDKYVADVVYYTTGCKRGKAYAIVTHSAKMSFVGRTATLVSGAKDQGHFKAIMNSIGTTLLVLVVGWILIAWIGGFFHHLSIATPDGSSLNLLHYALILLIVGVPVGLPVVTTTTLAVGAAYLAEEKAIVQKLTAIESLAVSARERLKL
jgi:H+-transporting ATPase